MVHYALSKGYWCPKFFFLTRTLVHCSQTQKNEAAQSSVHHYLAYNNVLYYITVQHSLHWAKSLKTVARQDITCCPGVSGAKYPRA